MQQRSNDLAAVVSDADRCCLLSTDNAGQLAATVQVRRSGDVRLAGLAGVLKCRKTATLDRSATLSVWLTRNASHYQTTSASLPGKTLGSSTWTPRASSISCRR